MPKKSEDQQLIATLQDPNVGTIYNFFLEQQSHNRWRARLDVNFQLRKRGAAQSTKSEAIADLLQFAFNEGWGLGKTYEEARHA